MRNQPQTGLPAPQGLYDPRFEHDACGVSFVASMKGVASRSIVAMGLGALCNLQHRGATGAEADTGDGAGILIRVPDLFLREVVGFELPTVGGYAVGLAFLPLAPPDADKAEELIETIVADEGLTVLGWRDVPVNPECLGASARAVMPICKQLFISDPLGATGIDLDRKVFVARKRIEHELPMEQQTYFPSLSSRTLLYKGMLTTPQLAVFFTDLGDERFESSLALVHSRFSTN
ncbi:MAG TPA: glutamate synthase subunit alpha, partial [Ilumatobacteraceae bacterium]|nr:glutamate synthase subunit alpha [Ilumatobacteraceae bacterium]